MILFFVVIFTILLCEVSSKQNFTYHYSASDTNSDQQNFVDKGEFEVCGTMTASMCAPSGGSCVNNSYLRIVTSGNQVNLAPYTVAYNDDYCGLCSQVSLSAPTGTCVYNLILRMGCYGSDSCSGTVVLTGAVLPATYAPDTSSSLVGLIVGGIFGTLLGIFILYILYNAYLAQRDFDRSRPLQAQNYHNDM